MAWENEREMDVLDVENMQEQTEVILNINAVQERLYVPVKALSHTPPYKIHKYFARRPWNVFKTLINTYSDKGEIILDPFCGGGVTIYEGLSEGRKVIGFDLNPLSILVVKNMVKQFDNPELFTVAFNDCQNYLDNLYENTQFYKHEEVLFRTEWYELCFKISCNYCESEIQLSNANKVANGVYKCSNPVCESTLSKKQGVEPKNCKRVGQDYLFKVGYAVDGTKRIEPIVQEDLTLLDDHIRSLKKEIKKLNISISVDSIPRNWDRQFEDQLFQKGIKSFQDFFTQRNLLILNLLLNRMNSFKDRLSGNDFELFRLCFSNTIKDTSIMSFTNDMWQSGRPAAWSKHAYWVPSQFCEVNISKAFKASFQRIKSAVIFNEERGLRANMAKDYKVLKEDKESNVLLINSSIANSDLLENSVDAIVTDPPYGSNVQYLELSHFWYPWNRDLYEVVPDFSIEAISNRKKNFEGSKSMYTYEQNLLPVFTKCYQVLKPGKNMVLTFNNKDVSAWLALLFSIFRSGFTMETNGLFFQDGVKNYKQTAHTRFEGSPYGDFIYCFKKDDPMHTLKMFNSEESFREELDGKFKKWMSGTLENKNNTILEMFLDVIPLIEGFSKSFLADNSHELYTFFKKDYFKNLF